jgi:two-component system CAI-1 autoinducer sensor kinase/phosphatase CqsS
MDAHQFTRLAMPPLPSLSSLRTPLHTLLQSPREPVLHLSRARLIALGLIYLIVHLSAWAVYTYVAPQAYESFTLRALAALGAVPLFLLDPDDVAENAWAHAYVLLYLAVAGPVLQVWLYFMNGGADPRVLAVCLVALLMYVITDWRYATAMLVAAFGGGLALAASLDGLPVAFTREHGFMFALSWLCGLLLGVSSARQDQHRLRSTLAALGVMAHELRTPLASMGLLVESLRDNDESASARRAGQRLELLMRNLHQQIDSQIVNAQLLVLRPGAERIAAREMVQEAIDSFPFRVDSERRAVVLEPGPEFHFRGTRRLFTQVVHNLLRNALVALRQQKGAPSPGDISLATAVRNGKGVLEIRDRGPGIPRQLQRSVFRPFVSTADTHSNGLGLAFCQNTVRVHKGRLTLNSSETGTTFVLALPLDHGRRAD